MRNLFVRIRRDDFDMEEHFERLATYEEMAVCTKDASRNLIKVAPSRLKTLLFTTMVGEILNADFPYGLPTIYTTNYSPGMIRKVR